MDTGHTHQPNARIGQFPFDESFDFLPQSFSDSPAMVLESTLLQLFHLRVKRMRISENWPQVLGRQIHSRALLQGPGKYRGNNAIEAGSVLSRSPYPRGRWASPSRDSRGGCLYMSFLEVFDK